MNDAAIMNEEALLSIIIMHSIDTCNSLRHHHLAHHFLRFSFFRIHHHFLLQYLTSKYVDGTLFSASGLAIMLCFVCWNLSVVALTSH